MLQRVSFSLSRTCINQLSSSQSITRTAFVGNFVQVAQFSDKKGGSKGGNAAKNLGKKAGADEKKAETAYLLNFYTQTEQVKR
jgi:hypothetical protein